MTVTREDEKPWKTDLARKAAQRREQVGQELEEVIKKAPSFEEALRQAVELAKKRFARYSSVTAYVADGEELAVHTALERPQGPERVASGSGPLAEAAQGQQPTVFSDLSASPAWAQVGLASGSAMVAPVDQPWRITCRAPCSRAWRRAASRSGHSLSPRRPKPSDGAGAAGSPR